MVFIVATLSRASYSFGRPMTGKCGNPGREYVAFLASIPHHGWSDILLISVIKKLNRARAE